MHFISLKNSTFCTLIIALLFVACSHQEPVTSVTANGEEIVFTNEGKGQTALVFVHGFANTKELWETQVMHFSKDYQVIAIDLPGFGESSHNRTTWSMKGFGDDVNAVVKGLDVDKVVLIGFSMGAPVVIEASKKTKNLAGVILVDDIRDLTAKFSDEMIEGMKGYINDLLKDPTQEKLVAGGFFTQNLEEATAKVQAFRATNYWQEEWDSIITSYLQWYNELGASSIQECPVPIAMINSDLQPMNLDYTRELVPSIHIDIVPGSGHVIMWDFPDKFNELVEANVRRFMNNN